MLFSNTEKPSTNSITTTLGNVLSGIPFLLFLILVCYALSVSNTSEVHDACGHQLWQFVIAHLIVPIGLSLVIILCTVTVVICIFGFSDSGENNMLVVFVVVAALLLCMQSSLFLGFGYPIVRDAMYSDTCVKALSHVSFTNTPLLGILGCIYLVSDVIVLSLLVFAVLFFGFLFCTSSSSSSIRRMEYAHLPSDHEPQQPQAQRFV